MTFLGSLEETEEEEDGNDDDEGASVRNEALSKARAAQRLFRSGLP